MNKDYQLTEEGIKELREELDNLIARRPEMAEAIKTAREFGDLSENAEYQLARDDQERTEARIKELEDVLAVAKIIKKSGNNSKVEMGSHVELGGGSVRRELQVVGTVEADPMSGKISNESPIGQALLGKSVGETVEIGTRPKAFAYKIVKIY
jgi:transcription elongation factor GreA